MSDVNSSAAFTEILQLGVDTDAFSSQMDQVVAIYAAAISKMPNIDGVAGFGLSSVLSELKETIQSFSSSATEGLGQVQTSMADTASVIQSSMIQAAESVIASQSQIVEALTQIRAAEDGAAESAKTTGSTFTSFAAGMAGGALSMAKTVLVYRAISEAINLVGATISAPFKAIGDGFTYLQQEQERGTQIQAALLQSVSFSADWATNVKIAGQQADILIKKVDEFAAKLKVSSQTVQTGFTSFLEAGGRNLTGSLNDALSVSAIFTGALQTQNPTVDSRKMFSEMQKSVQGAAGDSDKLAIALGISGAKMRELVDHAKKYHDLYQEILVFAPGIVERLGEANDKQVTLEATLQLYVARWEGLIAGPLFDRFTSILQSILVYLDAHSESLTQMGIELGKMVDLGAQFVQNFLKANWDGLTDTFRNLAKIVMTIGAELANFVSDAILLTQIGHNVKGSFSGASQMVTAKDEQSQTAQQLRISLSDKLISQQQYDQKILESEQALRDKIRQIDKDTAVTSVSDTFGQWKKNIDGSYAALSKMSDLLDNLGKNRAKKLGDGDLESRAANPTEFDFNPAAQQEAPNVPTHGINTKVVKPKFDNTALKSDEQELRAEIEKTKTAYQDRFSAVSDEVAKQVINRKQAAVQISALYNQEMTEINALIDAKEKKTKSSGGNPNLVNAAVAKMELERATFQANARKAVQAAQRAAYTEDVEESKAHFSAMMQMQLEYAKESLAALKQSLAEGYATQTQVFDAETGVMEQEYINRRDIDQADIANTAAGTAARVKAVEALDLLDAQHTSTFMLRTQERIDVANKEAQANFQHTQEASRLALARQALINSGSDHSGDRSQYDSQQALLALSLRITDQAIANAAAQLAEARAKNVNAEATQKLSEALATLQNERLKQFNEGVAKAGAAQGDNPGLAKEAQQNYANTAIAKVQQQADLLADAIQKTTTKIQAAFLAGDGNAVVSGINTNNQQKAQLDAVNASLAAMKTILDASGLSWTKAGKSLENSVLGPNFQDQWDATTSAWEKANGAMGDLTAGVGVAAIALGGLDNIGKTIESSIAQYSAAQKKGGVIGGVGSLLSSGPLSDAASMIPVIGPLVKPLGDAFQFIGDMFVAEAARIAKSIDASITAINQAYSNGATTLSQTIAQLQAQRASAVAQLSGVKGGQAQLNTILPTLDNEIASLQNQAATLMKTFQDQLTVLQSGGTELQSWTSTWQAINKQVDDYLAAGGSMATANAFLAASLATQQQTLTDSLNSGEQQAIQDAISLNNLIQQRIDLQRQEAETEFGITSQNAIEKRSSTGVQVASQLANQQYSYNEQLEDLNNQISLATQKVALESQVFNIASDTATLQLQSNALTITSLNEQLAIYEQMAQILAATSGMTFTGTSFNPVVPGTGTSGPGAVGGVPAPLAVTVNVNAGTQDVNSMQFATYVAEAVQSKVTANRTSF